MSDRVKVKFIVMQDRRGESSIYGEVGNQGRFDTYEAAEAACRTLAGNIPADLLGAAPEYWIKKVFTV